jgi:hypothetical protein
MYGSNEADSVVVPRAPTTEESATEATELYMGAIPPEDRHLRPNLFPMLLARRAPHMFLYEESTFHVDKSKAGSARVVVWQATRLPACYTLEMSFFGSDFGALKGVHYNPQHYAQMGAAFALAVLDFVSEDPAPRVAAYHHIRTMEELQKREGAAPMRRANSDD